MPAAGEIVSLEEGFCQDALRLNPGCGLQALWEWWTIGKKHGHEPVGREASTTGRDESREVPSSKKSRTIGSVGGGSGGEFVFLAALGWSGVAERTH